MNHSVWNKRVPGLFFVVLLAFGFVIASFISNTKTAIFTRASPGPEPKDVQITNVTDTSFTVSFVTNASTASSLSFGQNGKLQNVAFDSRDSAQGAKTYNIHYFIIKSLSSETTYQFTILSRGNTYDNGGKPYEVSTLPTLSTPNTKTVIKGTILFPDTVSHEAVIYATASGTLPISALINSDDTFMLPVSFMRTAQGNEYITPETTPLHLLVEGNGVETKTDLANGLDIVLPPLFLGSSYDFSQNAPTQTVATSAAFPTTTLRKTIQTKVQILKPENGQAFSTQKPIFTGTAAPRSTVTITIHSNEVVNTTVRTDATGNWTYTPTSALAPGEHTMTITALDAFGISRTVTTTFYVYAQGGQFLVPSVATQTPTPTTINPSPTVTTVLSSTPTITPTIPVLITSSPTPTTTQVQVIDTPTSTLAPTLTFTITPTKISVTSCPKGNLLCSGSNDEIISILVASIPVILGGLLIYLSKGIIR